MNAHFLSQFAHACGTFVELFEDSCDGEGAADERKRAHGELIAVVRDLFGTYFTVVRRRLAQPPPPPAPAAAAAAPVDNAAAAGGGGAGDGGGEGAERDALFDRPPAAAAGGGAGGGEEESKYASLTTAAELLLREIGVSSRLVREAQLSNKAVEAVAKVMAEQVSGAFGGVRNAAMRTFAGLHASAEETVRACAEEAARADAAAAAAAAAPPARGAVRRGGGAASAEPGPIVAAARRAARSMLTDLEAALRDVGPLLKSCARARAPAPAPAPVWSPPPPAGVDAPAACAGSELLPDMVREFHIQVVREVRDGYLWLCGACERFADVDFVR